jgi:hypothetical protein
VNGFGRVFDYERISTWNGAKFSGEADAKLGVMK